MLVTENLLQEILKVFGCTLCQVEKRETLVEIDFWEKETHVVKHYEKVHAGDIYVVKLLLLPMSPPQFWQAQAVFAEMYRRAGIPTPRRLPVQDGSGKYVYSIQIEGESFMAMVETWAGEQLTDYSEETAIYMAGLLGRMHAVSEENKCCFRPGSLYREVCGGKTAYLPLWKRTGTEFLPGDILEETLKFYEIRFNRMRKAWEKLPRYTVQGDMYWMNLARRGNQLQIIDYDRMGDEVLLADLMLTWFRFWYDEKVQLSLTGVKMDELWDKFFGAYQKERALKIEEKLALPDVYAVFGSIYCTRMLAQKAAMGNEEEAGRRFKEVLKLLKTSEEIV